MLKRISPFLFAAAIAVLTPTPGFAAGAPGGISVSGVSVPASGKGPPIAQFGTPIFMSPYQRFRDLTVAGQVGVDPSKLPEGAKVVRLRLDGRDIPMRLDTERKSFEIVFDPNMTYARDLYRAVLNKRVEVVGQQALRDQIAEAADKKMPLEINGYVFNRNSPYLVVRSVKPVP